MLSELNIEKMSTDKTITIIYAGNNRLARFSKYELIEEDRR
jgi:hypothetical protein